MDQTPDQWSADQWKSTLGFVPTREARAAATQQKVDFLMGVIKGNPLVTAPFMQKVLLKEPNPLVYKLKGYIISWVSRELGNQFLTLCLKETRESIETFVLYSLHTIKEQTLTSISIKGKKARFRDWRDVVFAAVKELPVVKYKNKLQVQLPEGYELVTSNHQMLTAAEQFSNCAFKLSDELRIIEGNEFVLIIPPDKNGVEPVMFHGAIVGKFVRRIECKHRNNIGVSLAYKKEIKKILNSILTEYVYVEKQDIKEEEKEEEVVEEDFDFNADPDAPWEDNVFYEED